MKWFTFDEIEHDGYGEPYAIERNINNPRMYKERDRIRWYENGLVEINTNTENSPRLRRHHYQRYGLDWRLKDEMDGLRFSTPEGEPVYKNAIINNGVFLLDHKHGMMLQALPWRGYKIAYYSEHARPTGGFRLGVAVRNTAAAKEMMKRRADELSLCLTVASLSDADRSYPDWPETSARAISKNPDLFTATHDVQVVVGLGLIASRRRVMNTLAYELCERREVPFLYFKEKA